MIKAKKRFTVQGADAKLSSIYTGNYAGLQVKKPVTDQDNLFKPLVMD